MNSITKTSKNSEQQHTSRSSSTYQPAATIRGKNVSKTRKEARRKNILLADTSSKSYTSKRRRRTKPQRKASVTTATQLSTIAMFCPVVPICPVNPGRERKKKKSVLFSPQEYLSHKKDYGCEEDNDISDEQDSDPLDPAIPRTPPFKSKADSDNAVSKTPETVSMTTPETVVSSSSSEVANNACMEKPSMSSDSLEETSLNVESVTKVTPTPSPADSSQKVSPVRPRALLFEESVQQMEQEKKKTTDANKSADLVADMDDSNNSGAVSFRFLLLVLLLALISSSTGENKPVTFGDLIESMIAGPKSSIQNSDVATATIIPTSPKDIEESLPADALQEPDATEAFSNDDSDVILKDGVTDEVTDTTTNQPHDGEQQLRSNNSILVEAAPAPSTPTSMSRKIFSESLINDSGATKPSTSSVLWSELEDDKYKTPPAKVAAFGRLDRVAFGLFDTIVGHTLSRVSRLSNHVEEFRAWRQQERQLWKQHEEERYDHHRFKRDD